MLAFGLRQDDVTRPVRGARAKRGGAAFPAAFLALASILSSPLAFAWGLLEADTTSFLRSSRTRATTITTLLGGPRLSGEGSKLAGKLDAQAVLFLEDRSSLTVRATDAYLATSQAWTGPFEASAGRRILSWSRLDDEWRLGLWNPRFLWDPLRPDVVGLTGFFAHAHGERLRAAVFATPVSIPETGYPVTIQNGSFKSASPWFVAPPEAVKLSGKEIGLEYRLDNPSLRSALVRPGVAAKVEAGGESGPWGALSAGSLPVNQIDLGVETFLRAKDLVLDTTLHPRFLHHRLATFETGWRESAWDLWASVTREVPSAPEPGDGWVTRPIGPAWIGAVGAGAKLVGGALRLGASYLLVSEEAQAGGTSRIPELQVSLPSRFLVYRGTRLAVGYDTRKRFLLKGAWTTDLARPSHLVSTEADFNTGWAASALSQGLVLGAAVDVIASAEGKGWIGQYRGNDRVRARVSYEF